MLTFTKLPDGNLKITATDEERNLIREMMADPHTNYFRITGDLLEDHTCNGWDWIAPDRIGALTDDSHIILSDDVLENDQGEILYMGNAWHDNDFAIREWFATLAERGEVIFENVGPTEYTDDETTEWLKGAAAMLTFVASGGVSNYTLAQGFDSLEQGLANHLNHLRARMDYDNDEMAPSLRKLAMLRQMRERVLGDAYVTP